MPNLKRFSTTRALRAHGAALERLARSYEADADKRQDLLREIHLALWRSFRAHKRVLRVNCPNLEPHGMESVPRLWIYESSEWQKVTERLEINVTMKPHRVSPTLGNVEWQESLPDGLAQAGDGLFARSQRGRDPSAPEAGVPKQGKGSLEVSQSLFDP
jgi:hypothetical protein